MENSVLQRFKYYMKFCSLKNKDVALKIGMPEKTFNNKMNGLRGFDIVTLIDIALQFEDLSTEWLLRGKGEMLIEKTSLLNENYSTIDIENIKSENEFLKSYINMLTIDLQEIKHKSESWIEKLRAI